MEKRKDTKGRVLKTGESQRKDGTYSYRYTYNNKRFSVYGRTLSELREKEREIQNKIDDGIDYAAGRMTVKELADKYMSLKTEMKPATVKTYGYALKVIKSSDFGLRRVSDVKQSEAKEWVLEVSDGGRRQYNSVTKIVAFAKAAFEMAKKDEIIRQNPFDFKISTVIKQEVKEKEALTKEQQNSFIFFLKEDNWASKYYYQFYILLNTGLRASEFCGLTIDCLDFDKNLIHVDKQLIKQKSDTYVVQSLKTKTSERFIPMTQEVRRCFKELIKKDTLLREKTIIDGYTGFLSFTLQGSPKVLKNIQEELRRVINFYNNTHEDQLPKFSPHMLRHTFCTNLIMNGMDVKSAQYLMGHSSIQMTLKVYTHVSTEKAALKMLEILEPNTPNCAP